MKNTLALGAVILGALLVYSGYKGWSFADTIRFFTGQKQKDVKPDSANDENDGGAGLAPGFDDKGNLEVPGTPGMPFPIPGLPYVPGTPGFEIPNPFSDVIPGNPVPAPNTSGAM